MSPTQESDGSTSAKTSLNCAERGKSMHKDIVICPERLKVMKTKDAIFRSPYDFKLQKQDLKQAFSELGETEDLVDACLVKLKKLLSSDQNMRYRMDDEYLLRYLRYRKFDCKKAYTAIRNLCQLRATQPDTFVVPSDIESMLNLGIIKCLQYRDEAGSIILWIDTKKWHPEEITMFSLLQVANAFSDLMTMNPSCQVNSVISMYDLGGLTARHVAQYFNSSILSAVSKCLQDSYPWRTKRYIGINCNKTFRAIYYLVSHMIKKKNAERLVLLGSDVTEIHQFVSPKLLPKEYGGCIDESECSVTQHVLDNLEYLKYERSFGAL